ncbi:MAG: Ig-like domain-containing protein [Candidatus Levyibacteriota bacterium]
MVTIIMKKVLLLLLPLVLVPILLFGIKQILQGKQIKPGVRQTPQLTAPTPISSSSSLIHVISTTPPNKAINTPLNQKITIVLDKFVSEKDITFSTFPQANLTLSIDRNIINATISGEFFPSTTYKYVVTYKNYPLPITYSFTTEGPTPTPRPKLSVSVKTMRDDWNRENHPDIFLSSQLPQDTNTFSADYRFTQIPYAHYAFTVTAKIDANAAKTDFISWMKSLGITDEQIQTLDITYQ